jgi:hypothetical protein
LAVSVVVAAVVVVVAVVVGGEGGAEDGGGLVAWLWLAWSRALAIGGSKLASCEGWAAGW